MRYRRTEVAGATYFFTVNLLNRRQTLLTDHIDTLRACIKTVKKRHPFHIDAMVILPDHLHAIWTLPPGDADFAKRWMLVKTAFSRSLPKHEIINQSRKLKRERGIWQRRYWEHLIRDDLDYQRHVDYIHYNPVKHGYVDKVVEWPYSSIHWFIDKGIITSDWSVGETIIFTNIGEH
ncbi:MULTISPECIES: transposase [unclassified Methylophaga]|jgi:putative transposase|uniref:REP-associated tyrosine transposase n=1 Tax=unclassified Methylophaga TaxID=2629249 RepID=UPI000C96CB5C|nr:MULTISPECIES: transposase [unclassified Methylophaga]MAK65608.1 transposase [Methylophaga sp.]MAY16331.1 transposase [Methylophaga sp.]HCD06594.1 transposase [Methylophaga sp.]|tara:strand:+ start:9874 stop:10404 length:531 start_codon:yes stop_codon:yes gene_type:complete